MEVLVVLEHQPLRGVPVQRVVRGAALDELVELREESEPALALDKSQPDLSLGSYIRHQYARLEENCYSFDQIAKLGEDALGKEIALCTKSVYDSTYCLVSTSNLLADRCHPYSLYRRTSLRQRYRSMCDFTRLNIRRNFMP